MTSSKSSKKDQTLYLKSLKADGIEEIFIPRGQKPTQNPVVSASAAQGPAIQAPCAAKDSPAPGLIAGGVSNVIKEQILELRQTTQGCPKCLELCTTRKSVVFGAGNLKAQLVFVGEAPGRDEDIQGLPFVGRAGQLLTKMIEAIKLTREDIFICNVLKCRPPGNRPPKPDEIENCEPYLKKQLELISPKIICALGTFAAQTLLKTDIPISKLRGEFHSYQGIKLLCSFHPAYLLRNPAEKVKSWEDLKMIRKELDSLS